MKRTVIKKWTEAEDKVLRETASLQEAAAKLHRSYASVNSRSANLKMRRTDTEYPDAAVPQVVPEEITSKLPKLEFGHLPLTMLDSGGWFRYGLVADTHLCCKEERLSELHATYDLFQREGIDTVFHAGNIVDGYVARINGASVFETTPDGQAQYVADNYPARKGITTHFITGDDHDGVWWSPGFNFGAYLRYVCEKNDRHDLNYIGHVEADVEIKHKTGASTIIKIQHPGGGSSYARSYTGQKQVESWEGGEKSNILIQGHFHVSNYCQDRNVHIISMPGFKDQDAFTRKKRLRTEVGSAILEFKVNPADGTVTRCRVEFQRYFTRGYYKRYLRSDSKLLKGHLILKK